MDNFNPLHSRTIKVEDADLVSIQNFNKDAQRFRNEHVKRLAQHRAQSGGRVLPAPIIIPDDEDDLDAVVKQSIEDEIGRNYDIGDSNDDDVSHLRPCRVDPRQIIRNGHIPENRKLQSYRLPESDIIVRIGDLIETGRQEDSLYNARFLHIKAIYREGTEEVIFRGIPYTRARNLMSMAEPLRNEIWEIWNIQGDDTRQFEEQAQVQVAAMIVEKVRTFRITNTQWPEFACDKSLYGDNLARTENEGPLTCRWRMVTYYTNSRNRLNKRPISRTLYHLREGDLDSKSYSDLAVGNRHKVKEETKLNNWRGAKTRGGSYKNGSFNHDFIDLDQGHATQNQPFEITGDQMYTFGDMFCGAGGASCGARDAGVKVYIACDIDRASCESYRMNFPDTILCEENVSDVVMDMHVKDCRVDILHISPPCQYWSPAHTRDGKNDEANHAILFSCREIVNKFRPRIVTVEQTFGILRSQHTQAFHQLLNCFTSLGYSITWKYVLLSEWMVPQPRKRLIMVASCPGEFHPTIPGSSTIYPSINMFLHRYVDVNSNHHNPRELLGSPRYPRLPYDGNGILRQTLTCSCSDDKNYHPSGLRPFTIRELAALQTFPGNYQLVPSRGAAKRQVGNAFPPLAVEYLYGSILEQLREEDKVWVSSEVEEYMDEDEDQVLLVD